MRPKEDNKPGPGGKPILRFEEEGFSEQEEEWMTRQHWHQKKEEPKKEKDKKIIDPENKD